MSRQGGRPVPNDVDGSHDPLDPCVENSGVAAPTQLQMPTLLATSLDHHLAMEVFTVQSSFSKRS